MFKTILIIILVVAILLSIYLIFHNQIKIITYGLFKQKIIKKKLNKIAHDHDYLYISQSRLHVNSKNDAGFDNILVTPKYVYAIKNVYWYGILMAKEVDEKWTINENKGRNYIDNPLNLNYLRIKLLSNNCNIPIERIKNVVLYGDSLKIYSMELNPKKQSIFVSYKDFEKTLLEIEKNSDNFFSDEEQETIIKTIYEKNKESLSYRKDNK